MAGWNWVGNTHEVFIGLVDALKITCLLLLLCQKDAWIREFFTPVWDLTKYLNYEQFDEELWFLDINK